jgi:hypothetical protein
MGTRRWVYVDILQAMESRCHYMCQVTLTKQTSRVLQTARELMSVTCGAGRGVPGVDPTLTVDVGSQNALRVVA